MLNPPNRRGTDPYARWWGRGGIARCPPIPIFDPKATFMTSAREWSRGGKADVCTTQSPAHASSVSSAFASFLDREGGAG